MIWPLYLTPFSCPTVLFWGPDITSFLGRVDPNNKETVWPRTCIIHRRFLKRSSSCCQARLQRFMTLSQWRVTFHHTSISGPCSNDSIGVPQEQKVQSILCGIPEENKYKRLQKASTLNRFSVKRAQDWVHTYCYILHQSLDISWLLDLLASSEAARLTERFRRCMLPSSSFQNLGSLLTLKSVQKDSKGTCRTSLSWTFGRSCRFRTLHQVEQQPRFLAHACSLRRD